jgi:hypothetical protein
MVQPGDAEDCVADNPFMSTFAVIPAGTARIGAATTSDGGINLGLRAGLPWIHLSPFDGYASLLGIGVQPTASAMLGPNAHAAGGALVVAPSPVSLATIPALGIVVLHTGSAEVAFDGKCAFPKLEFGTTVLLTTADTPIGLNYTFGVLGDVHTHAINLDLAFGLDGF